MKMWEVIKDEQCNSAVLLPYFLSDLVAHEKKNKKDMFKLDVVATSGQSVGILHTKVFGVFTKTLIVGYGSVKELFVSALPPITTANEIKLVT